MAVFSPCCLQKTMTKSGISFILYADWSARNNQSGDREVASAISRSQFPVHFRNDFPFTLISALTFVDRPTYKARKKSGCFLQNMNTSYRTFADADTQWESQWQRIMRDWGDPKPARSQMNGTEPDGFLRWINSLTQKGEQEAAKATGDGYWECRVHWREVRISHLQQAKQELEQEMYVQKGHKLQKRSTVGSAVRPLYPTLRSSLPLNKSIVRASPPPPPKELDLSLYSIDESQERGKDEKLDSPPPSPSDLSFSVKAD